MLGIPKKTLILVNETDTAFSTMLITHLQFYDDQCTAKFKNYREPRSAVRMAQVEENWITNLPGLSYKNKHDRKEEWINWFLNIREGTSFKANAMSKQSRKNTATIYD